MANLPLAFAELLGGGVLLTMGISGQTAQDVFAGTVSLKPFDAGTAAGDGGQATAGAGPPASAALPKGHGGLLELIHNTGSGPGYAVKNGRVVSGPQVYGSVWAGHRYHVHVAAGPTTVVALGELAQRMGLHVSGQSHFGGRPTSGHAPNSYHYKDEAIDVSGPENLMDQFAAEVERLFGVSR